MAIVARSERPVARVALREGEPARPVVGARGVDSGRLLLYASAAMKRLPSTSLLSPLLLALLACSGSSSPAKDTGADAEAGQGELAKTSDPGLEEQPEVKPEAKTPGKAVEKRKKPAKPSIDEGRTMRRKLLTELNEGRKLTKAGKYEEAMARYREALTIDASDVAVLGELGWAAYKSGDLELAHRTTTAAMRFAKEDKQLGMLLYNLGRIDEDRGQLDAAAELYRVSLARRPNDVVQKRLDDLLAKQSQPAEPTVTAEIDAAMSSGLARLGEGLAGPEDACALLEKVACEDYTMDPEDGCECDPALAGAPGADQSWGLLHLTAGMAPTQEAWFPVVKVGEKWTVFAAVLYAYNPGAFGIYEEASVGASEVKALLGESEGTQLIFHLGKDRSDSDMGINEVESESYEIYVVCSRQGQAHCTVPLAAVHTYDRTILFDEMETEEEFDHTDSLGESHYRGKLDFADGKLKVSEIDASEGYALPAYDWLGQGLMLAGGEYDLRKLLGL